MPRLTHAVRSALAFDLHGASRQVVTGMEFCLLGPLAVRRGDTPVPVQAGKQRAVLAALLLNANRVVAVEQLAETLWGTAPPPSARLTVQNYVVRLRKALADEGRSRITTQPPGYVISVAAGELDITRFEVLLGAARQAAKDGSWDDAAAQARAAVALWRGEPLADVESELLAEREVPRLADLRLQALETRIEADLRLGRHGELTGELRRLACAHPLREHLHALLMLALYRDSRQAEALAAYQQARDVLVEELGAEPGPELQQLHQQILDADPALVHTEPAALGGEPTAAAWPAPWQLPAAVPHFTGRTAELAALTQILDDAGAGAPGTVVISAIGGTAGVGKTALALHWAHQVAARFGDGQLYVNLRGFHPSGTPVTAAAAIRGFLDILGVPPERIPASPEAQAGLYRSLLSGKRMLILLDNARDEQQARPLLPASPGSLVLVTSRSQLSGLAAADGARLISLDVLSHGEAVQMLTARLGRDRATAEPAAVDRIAGLCAWLPLALAVAAARAGARPGFPLGAVAAELADSAGRLDALDAGDPGSSVRAVLSWSTRQLTPDAARMFRLLGLHPGPDITVPAAASLAGTSEPEARRMLGELTRGCLIGEHLPGRYAFHDLLRAYAAEQAHHTDSDTDRRQATGRVLDHYLHTAAGAVRLLNPSLEPVVLALPGPGAAAGQPADHRRAMAWFQAEHQVLLAAVTLAAGSGFDTHAWQLPWAMEPFLRARGHYQEGAAIQRTALAAATRLGDAAAQAISGRLLANACTNLGDYDQALGHFASSLTLYQRLGSRFGEAKMQMSLAVLAERQGRYPDALGHAEQELRLYQAIGDKTSEAGALNNVGWGHCLLGDYQQARAFCRQALTLCAEIGHRSDEGIAWHNLGYAEHHLGNLAEAATCYQHALNLAREAGDRLTEAEALTHLGDNRHAADELAKAQEAWQQALAIFEDLQHPDAGQVRAKLASTNDHASPNPSA
jgi:DNA-binding SARP family transcriptional activator/tetratricopeptide (TPR) repeat protein